MNLSVLQRMLREGDVSLDAARYLLSCRTECEHLDYKKTLQLDDDKQLAAFARDALAFKNVGGGYIVVGVEDGSWEVVGLSSRLPYDTKQIKDKLRSATGLELDVDLVHHEVVLGGRPVRVAVLHFRTGLKRLRRRTPTVAAKDFSRDQPWGLRRGEIYVRRNDETVLVASQAELEQLLDALEAIYEQAAIEAVENVSPFAVDLGTYRLLEKGFETFIGRTALRQQVVDAVTRDPRIWIINIHGPGGVGKSALAAWATYHLYELGAFEAILQLTAKEMDLSRGEIRPADRSLYSLENLLDHVLRMFEERTDGDLEKKKQVVHEILSAWSMLLVLDNMETVSDGRILSFVQGLPPGSRAKVLLTSREKTGGWELPLPVGELNGDETGEFLRIKSSELGIAFPLDTNTRDRVKEASGGLPLAIQWMMVQYRQTGKLDPVLDAVRSKDSPVLEFSFRNIWQRLPADARALLALMSIMDGPVSVQDAAIATDWPFDQIEKAFGSLSEVTLVTRSVGTRDGRLTYTALPITLAFARHQLESLGEFESRCRQRLKQFKDQMSLQEGEVKRFRGLFEQYGLVTDNEKRAALLCRRGESEMFSGNADQAETLFKQARELAPQAAFVHAMSASFELANRQLTRAVQFIDEACSRADARTGSLCFSIKARVLDAKHDRAGRAAALRKALEFSPRDVVIRHQLGVTLSRMGRETEAIEEFRRIIEQEEGRVPLRETLVITLKTTIMNLRRLGREAEADLDLAKAQQILRANPHLRHLTPQIEALV